MTRRRDHRRLRPHANHRRGTHRTSPHPDRAPGPERGAGGLRAVPGVRDHRVRAGRRVAARGRHLAHRGRRRHPGRPCLPAPWQGRPAPAPRPDSILLVRAPGCGHQPGDVPGRSVPLDADERRPGDVDDPGVHLCDRRGRGSGTFQRSPRRRRADRARGHGTALCLGMAVGPASWPTTARATC